MSVWNVSHTIGSFSLGFFAIVGVALFADLGIAQTWRGNFVFPAVIAMGMDLKYTDEYTLAQAIRARQSMRRQG